MLTLWTTDNDHTQEWESSWLVELLPPNLIHYHDPLLTSNPPQEPSLVIINPKSKERNQALYTYLSKFIHPFSLIHLSDENYSSNYTFYDLPNCRKVWRNYWHPYFQENNKVSCFALGYKKDYPLYHSNLPRTKTWCFSGDFKYRHYERTNAVNTFKLIPNHIFISEQGNSFTNRITGLDTPEYKAMFQQSHFALCPPGNINIDNFRICEALEVGTIPVVIPVTREQNYNPSYWEELFQTPRHDLPFVMEDNWEKCKNKVLELLNQPEELEQLHQQCSVFWSNYKHQLHEKWKNLLSP